MSDVLDDVLGDTPKEAPKGVPEGEALAPQPQTPPEAPQGTPGPDAAPATDASTTGATTPPPGYVPLSALLDDREKRQKAQAEADRLKAEVARLQAAQAPSQPTYSEDPEGWARAREQEIAQNRRDTTFRISEAFATRAHGAELVEKAKAWSDEKARAEAATYGFSPHATMVLHQFDPLDWVVTEYQQAQRLAEIGTDWDAWARKRAAELAAQTEPGAPVNGHAPPQPATAQARPAFSPPKSLVDAPSAGGMRGGTPVGPAAAFDALFPK